MEATPCLLRPLVYINQTVPCDLHDIYYFALTRWHPFSPNIMVVGGSTLFSMLWRHQQGQKQREDPEDVVENASSAKEEEYESRATKPSYIYRRRSIYYETQWLGDYEETWLCQGWWLDPLCRRGENSQTKEQNYRLQKLLLSWISAANVLDDH